MKKILFILAFVYTVFSYGQGGPKVDAIKFKGDVTTTVRDAIDVPVGETWLIYNVTTDKVEFASSDDVWHDLTQLPLIDDNNLATATSTNVASASSVKNYVDFYAVELTGGSAGNRSADFAVMDTGTGVSGFQIVGGNDQAQVNGGVVGADHSLVVGPTAIWSLSQTNSVIDTFGPTAIVTRNYTDTNYISKDSIVDSDTFASVSPTTVPSSESVKAYVDASISGSGAVPDDTGSSNGDVLTTDGAGTYTWQTPTSGSSPPFDDTTSLVQDPVDNTKQLRFDVEDVNTSTTALFSVAGSNLFNATMGIRGGVLNDTSYFYNYLSDKTTVASKYGYDGTLNAALMTNATSNDSIVLPDTGGIRMTDALTATSFIKDGATSDDVLLGDGTTTSLAGINTDDQTASEVNITDAAGNFLSTNVEDALNETVGFIDAKFDNTGGTIGGNINFQDTYKATGLANPTVGSDAVNLSYLQGKEGSGFVTEHPDSGQTGIRIGVGTEAEKAAATLLANDIWISTDGKKKYVYTVPITAQGDDIAVATSVTSFFTTRAITVTNVWASLSVAPTGSVATFDINEDGTTILSTKITIDATEKTSSTAATPPVISDTAIAAFAELTFDIDGVGSSTPGTTGTIYIEYTVDDE